VGSVVSLRAVLALVGLALVSCSCSAGSSRTAPTTTAAAPVTQPTTSAPCPTFAGGTFPRRSYGARPVGLLTDASAGEEGCLDRVTFFFRSLGDGTPPGYLVQYQNPPFSTGDPPRAVTPNGAAFLAVNIARAASVDITQPAQPRTYLGNLFLQYGDHHHLVEIEKLDDALGTVRWVIALDIKRPFLVDSAANPTRISVYIS
jgi:hypothetical protein